MKNPLKINELRIIIKNISKKVPKYLVVPIIFTIFTI